MRASLPLCFATTRPSWVLGVLLLTLCACASPYRRVELGTAPARIGAAGADTGVEVQASGDRFQIDFHITTSEATEVQLQIECPGGLHEATLGESMASYRERRLRELQYERERQEQERTRRAEMVAGAVSGSVAAQAPGVAVQANVQVDASALAGTEAPPVALGPYDRGAQSMHQTIVLPGGGAGRCRMSLLPIAGAPALAGVTGYMEVTHIVDRARERNQVRIEANARALDFRASIKADLIARGADPELRSKQEEARQEREHLAYQAQQAALEEANRKRREELVAEQARKRELYLQARAEARAGQAVVRPPVAPVVEVVVAPPPRIQVELRADIEIRREAEVTAALALEASRHEAALRLRKRLIDVCIAGGADLYYRARLRQQAFDEQERKAREAQLRVQAKEDARIEAESRLRLQLIADLRTRETLVAYLIARGADPEYRRKQNEADLLSFEERSRAARYQARLDAQVETELPSAQEGDLHVDFSASTSTGSMATAIPPRPALPEQVRPPRPDTQSSWIAGFYELQGRAWVWVPGTWSTPPAQDAVWVPSIEVQLGGQLITRPGAWRTREGKRVEARAAARPRVRDHRR